MRKKNNRNKKAQEEMVGFALIVIIVAIIFMVFISIYIKKPQEKVADYETSSFVQAILQYTTICQEETLQNLTVQELLSKCQEGNPCYYNEIIHTESRPCEILNDTIKEIIKESWKVGPENPIKGYSFVVNVSEDGRTEEQFLNIKEGVVTNNYRGSEQDFGKSRGTWKYMVILFNVYG